MGKQRGSEEKLSYIEALNRYSNSVPPARNKPIIEPNCSETTDANTLDLDLTKDIIKLDSTLQRYARKNRQKCLACNRTITGTKHFTCTSCGTNAHLACYYPADSKHKDPGDKLKPEKCASCSDSRALCLLCHIPGGLVQKSRHFYHPACLLFGLSHNPLLPIDLDELIEKNASEYDAQPKPYGSTVGINQRACIACGKNARLTLQCGFPHCPFHIHPPCALKYNLGAICATLGQNNSKIPWKALFCAEHANPADIKSAAASFLRYQRLKTFPWPGMTCTCLSAMALTLQVHSSTTTSPTAPAVARGVGVADVPGRPVFQNFHPFAKGSWQRIEFPRRMPLGPAAARALALEPQSHHKKCLEEARLLMRLLKPTPLQPPDVRGVERCLELLKYALWSGRGSFLCRDNCSRVLALVSAANLSNSSNSLLLPQHALVVFTLVRHSPAFRSGGDYLDMLRSLATAAGGGECPCAITYPYFGEDGLSELQGSLNKLRSMQAPCGDRLSLETYIPLSQYEFELVLRGVVELSQDPLHLRLLTTVARPCVAGRRLEWHDVLRLHGVYRPRDVPPPSPPPSVPPGQPFVDIAGYRWVLRDSSPPCGGPSEEAFVEEQIDVYKGALASVHKKISQLKSSLLDSILSQNCEPLRLCELPSCKYLYLIADSSDKWSLMSSNLRDMVREDAEKWDSGGTGANGTGAGTACSVCFYEGKTNLNPLITCVRCGIVFHRSCYGVGQPSGGSLYPNRDWNSGELICKRCEVEKKALGTQWMVNFTRNSVLCSVCFRGGGAFKTTTGGQWIHVFCGLALLPSSRLLDPLLLEPWELPQQRPAVDYTIQSGGQICLCEPCRVCGLPLGITIRCSYSTPCNGLEPVVCDVLCHPMCAWLQGFRFDIRADPDCDAVAGSLRSLFPPFRLSYLCCKHDPSWDTKGACEFRRSRYINRDIDPAHNEARRKGRFKGFTRPQAEAKKADIETSTARLSVPSYDSKTCAVCFNVLSRDYESGFPMDDVVDNLSWIRCGECHVAVHLCCYMFDIAGTVGFTGRSLPNGLAPWPTPIMTGHRGQAYEILRDLGQGLAEEMGKVPKRWVCDMCTFGSSEDAYCAICERRGYGLKAWANFGCKTGKDLMIFVHVVCLIWHAEYAVSLIKQSYTTQDAGGNGQSCAICSSHRGVFLACSKPGCSVKFHASCAYQVGLVLHKRGLRVKRRRRPGPAAKAGPGRGLKEGEDEMEAESDGLPELFSSDYLHMEEDEGIAAEDSRYLAPQRSQYRYFQSEVSLCPCHSEVASRFASSIFLFFRLKESLGLTVQLAKDLRSREIMKRAWIRKRKQLLNAAFPLLQSFQSVP